jgi:hypothetical protein
MRGSMPSVQASSLLQMSITSHLPSGRQVDKVDCSHDTVPGASSGPRALRQPGGLQAPAAASHSAGCPQSSLKTSASPLELQRASALPSQLQASGEHTRQRAVPASQTGLCGPQTSSASVPEASALHALSADPGRLRSPPPTPNVE